MVDAQRRALVAVVLSVVGAVFGVAGAGHAYLREWRRAFAWFALVIGASLVLISAFADPETATPASLPLRVTVPLVALLALNAVDAYYVARRSVAGGTGSTAVGTGSASAGTGPTGTKSASPEAKATLQCSSCGRDLDPELSFCPWCAGEREGEGRE